jgi:drug/metabolite transporter (DMT)-like permease
MTAIGIGLVLVSALIHVGWNLVGKRQHPSAAFLLVANTLGFLCLTPVVIVYRDVLPAFPMVVWLWLVATGLFQALYYATLAGAYRSGELSVVYPLARSGAVVFVVLLNALLGRGGQLSGLALGGMASIVLGGLLLPLQRVGDVRLAHYLVPATLLALLAALGTAGYSIVDDEALHILRSAPRLPVGPLVATALYSFFEGLTSSLWLAALVLARKRGRAELHKTWRTQAWQAGLTGIGIYAGYTLVLVAMAFVSNVSYVVAFRQVSVPLGTLAGVLALRDPPHVPKLVGVAVMFAGLVLVGLG